MHINLPDRIPTGDLIEDIPVIIRMLESDGITSVGEVRITLRAFNADGRECYPADTSGHHDMGFTVTRPGSESLDASGVREVSWNVPGSNPEPVEEDGLEAVWNMFGEQFLIR